MILYLETNFLIGVAKGQIEIEPFTNFAASGATLAVPDACFMEAFAYAERIEKLPGGLRALASEQVRGIWGTSRLAANLQLQQAIEEAQSAYELLKAGSQTYAPVRADNLPAQRKRRLRLDAGAT